MFSIYPFIILPFYLIVFNTKVYLEGKYSIQERKNILYKTTEKWIKKWKTQQIPNQKTLESA